MTSPTTQVNSSRRIMEKSSSSLCQVFTVSLGMLSALRSKRSTNCATTSTLGSVLANAFYRTGAGILHDPRVPSGSLEERLAFARIFAGNFLVQLDSQARLLRQPDRPVLNDRLRNTFHQVIPERHVRSMKLEHKEIWDRRAEVCRSQGPDRAADTVWRHRDGLRIRKLRDLTRNRQPSDFLYIRRRDSHGVRLQYFSKSFEQI